jgi:hypothetical protein
MDGDRLPVPWWRVATLVTLGAGLGLSVAKAETVPTVLLAVFIVPYLVFFGVWISVFLRSSRRE